MGLVFTETMKWSIEKSYRVPVIKSEYGAGLENQIKANPYQQLPTEPDHEKARPPSGHREEQKDHHLLPQRVAGTFSRMVPFSRVRDQENWEN